MAADELCARTPSGDYLRLVADDPVGADLAMPRFTALARPRPGDGWTVRGAEVIERAAEEWAARLVDEYGWAAAAVAALVRADTLDPTEEWQADSSRCSSASHSGEALGADRAGPRGARSPR